MHADILNIRLGYPEGGSLAPHERGRRIAVGLICATSSALKASALCLFAMLASAYGYKYDMMILVTILAPAIAFLIAFLGVIAMIDINIAILRSGTIELNKQPHMPTTANAMVPSRDC